MTAVHNRLRSPALASLPDRWTERALIALLLLTFLLGGGARSDIASLALLRPATAIVLAFAIVFAWQGAWVRGRAPLLFALSVVALVAAQLVPLPSSLWTALPGRRVVTDMFRAADIPLPWLPVSLAPGRTLNALFALMTPLAGLLLALNLPRASWGKLFGIIGAIAVVSALLGGLQAIGPRDGPLYFYRITNNGNAVGLFSNRNHQAIFLVASLPLLAVAAALAHGAHAARWRIAAMIGAAIVLPLSVATGSRTGLALLPVSAAAALWVFWRTATAGPAVSRLHADDRRRRRQRLWLGGVAVGAVLAALVALAARGSRSALARLFENDLGEDMRVTAFPHVVAMGRDVFPVGGGYGAFDRLYKIYEPRSALGPNYFNHAHNDWLEWLVTGGAPAMALMIAFAALFAYACWRVVVRVRVSAKRSGPSVSVAVGSAAALLVLVLSSIADYPLRTPSIMLAFAVVGALLWSIGTASERRSERGDWE